ncbi:TetR/AcrR family transcriptional regulator [Companilactobacillus sp.]|jgi:AcrR family transcriptional regulator|uniref:TetR/AcrR family transcriptional regulator n=1 Tax=Companilactobacillus sp. TaxID=2767905 RepID=UPI0025C47899|nr:TetR/AcrR family transcriptional regulator [Companilactobacillus sp.]MCH4009830.1 TetR/AcrR family transcriptional regulator [Companilactobacillus sp.]MCH4052494.1 TetR/AcrR family transcriptional regulator [Companilactobacillus sp.]MCH4077772.1 TetR/AcrR family transcriptional regulator [Companilactobacillus sp.]MCH4126348.1 TetR/AcrR family transcriptional regulator [Companilactobacillus sp.]MCI1312056.1 TetR/AcrR family transcriptional regulator [Companilactobacillus sp.]
MHDIISIYEDSPETHGLTEKQLKIFRSAIQLFAERGYANTSTKEIAENAGVSEGSIFKKFKNKEDLLFSILNPLLRNILPQVVNEFSEETLKTRYDSLRDFIAAVINNRNVFVKENVNVIKIFVDEFIYDLKIRDRMVKAIPYDYVKNFNDILNDFKQRNLIVDWTNSEIFRFIFSAFFGYVAEHFLIFPDLKFDEKSEIDHTIDSIVKGLQQE